MINIAISILAMMIALIVLIGIHEGGHFIAAKFLGIKILRFSLGLGKPLLGFTDKKGTEYVWSAFPVGGYVKLLDEREGTVSPEIVHLSFNRQPVWKRFVVIAAGPLFNLLFAVIVYWLLFLIGIRMVSPIIDDVLPYSPAAKAGVKPQQIITAIDDRNVADWHSVIIVLMMHLGDKNKITLTTKDHEEPANVFDYIVDLKDWHLDELRPDLLQSLGIVPKKPQADDYIVLQSSVIPAGIHAIKLVSLYTHLNLHILYKIATGDVSIKSLGGPVSIFQGAAVTFKQGIISFLNFLALLSIILAIINALPIPGLDGGQIIYLLVELCRGKPVSVAVQLLAFRLGLIVIFLLCILVLLNDMQRLLV